MNWKIMLEMFLRALGFIVVCYDLIFWAFSSDGGVKLGMKIQEASIKKKHFEKFKNVIVYGGIFFFHAIALYFIIPI